MKKRINIYTDGGARGNPGPAAVGFVVKGEREKILKKAGRLIGRATNNVAEYQAVVEALKWLVKNYKIGSYVFHFFSDAQLMVNQLNGLYKIKNARLRDLIIKVRQLEKKLDGEIFYHHIKREKNQEADAMVNRCFSS